MELFLHANVPTEFREMMEEMFQEEKGGRQRVAGGASARKEDSPQEPPACPHCGHTPFSPGEKCGYCLATLRPFFPPLRTSSWDKGEEGPEVKPAAWGLPPVCRKSLADDAAHLEKALLCREKALQRGRPDGAESLQDEINTCRWERMGHGNVPPLHVSSPFTRTFTALPPLHFQGRANFPLPSPQEEEGEDSQPLTQLAFTIDNFRTLVDLPGGFPDDPGECRRKVEGLLVRTPLLKGGYRVDGEDALYSANGHLRITLGRTEDAAPLRPDGRMTLSFASPCREAAFLQSASQKAMAWLEEHFRLFQDPALGYFHPKSGIYGSATRMGVTLHLPALMATTMLDRLQTALHFLEGALPMAPDAPALELLPPPFLQGQGEPRDEILPCGFLILRDNAMNGSLSGQFRMKRLIHMADLLGRREMVAREWLRHSTEAREDILDSISHSRALLRNARTLSRREMATALSRLWLGQELGCFPSLPRRRTLQALGLFLDAVDHCHRGLPPDDTPHAQRLRPLAKPPAKGAAKAAPQSPAPLLSWEEQVALPLPPQKPDGDSQERRRLRHQTDQWCTEQVRQILDGAEERRRP